MKRVSFIAATVCIITFVFGINTFAAPDFASKLEERLKGAVVLYIGSPKAYVNNAEAKIDKENDSVTPLIKDGRTLVPVRFIAESLGAKVEWNETTQEIKVNLNNREVVLVIGSKRMVANKVESELDVPAQIVNERTFIPLRALAEALGKKVFWSTDWGSKGVIIISDKENIIDEEKENWMIRDIYYSYLPSRSEYHRFIEKQGDWIYFQNSENNQIYRVKEDGTSRTRIINDEVGAWEFKGDWIYYINITDSPFANGDVHMVRGGKTYKIKLDGTEKTKLSDDTVWGAYDEGDWIYYSTVEDGQLYKMKNDGTQKTRLGEETNSVVVAVKDGWVYCITNSQEEFKIKTDGTNKVKADLVKELLGNKAEDGWSYDFNYKDNALYKAKPDGTNKTKILDEYGTIQGIVDGWIYYTKSDYADDKISTSILYRVKTDGSQKTKMTEYAEKVQIKDGYIYYFSPMSSGLYRIKLDGTEKTTLTDARILNINILDGWIYYTDTTFDYDSEDKTGYIYKIRIDGKDKHKIG